LLLVLNDIVQYNYKILFFTLSKTYLNLSKNDQDSLVSLLFNQRTFQQKSFIFVECFIKHVALIFLSNFWQIKAFMNDFYDQIYQKA
jgi:hypothetical protein